MVRNNVTHTRLVRIGNSRGLRIPKPLIEQAGLGDEVDLLVQNDMLIIRSAHRPRAGWAKAFSDMHEHGDDQMLDPHGSSASAFDRKEWTWR
jgi:antitoxin MazE